MKGHGKIEISPFLGATAGSIEALSPLLRDSLGGDKKFLSADDVFVFSLTDPDPLKPSWNFGRSGLKELGKSMQEPDHEASSGDSCIPAGYTYFGQFIDHDITHDLHTKLDPTGNHPVLSYLYQGTPMLDLNSVYGRTGEQLNKGKFELGQMTGGGFYQPFDLPRTPSDIWLDDGSLVKAGTASIPDARNEDNLIVSSMHLLFMVFHNALLEESGLDQNTDSGREIRKKVLLHYQWLVLRDYLDRICDSDTYNEVVVAGAKPKFYTPHPSGFFYMPLEFSGAAFRFGHSQVRARYNWSAATKSVPTRRLLRVTGLHELTGSNATLDKWKIDWTRFLEYKGSRGGTPGVNYARKINTWISSALSDLPPDDPNQPAKVLAQRTLMRGRDPYRLPSAQALAKQIGITPMTPKDIYYLGATTDERKRLFDQYDYHKRTPLWFYILLEASKNEGEKLGPMGSRIVAEVLYQLAKRSPVSIVDENGDVATGIAGSPFSKELKNGTFCLKHVAEYVSRKFPGKM
jgi:hypothetical protein